MGTNTEARDGAEASNMGQAKEIALKKVEEGE